VPLFVGTVRLTNVITVLSGFGSMNNRRWLLSNLGKPSRKIWAAAFIVASVAFGLGIAAAQEAPTAQAGGISIELNKLEPQGGQCRAYFVINNKSGTDYQELKLDLVLFKPDGVIGRRFAIDLAPLKTDKRTVKLFDIEGTSCEEVGSFLINDVMECKSASGPVTDCLKDISLSTLTKVQLAK
jgi:hypothetical protein